MPNEPFYDESLFDAAEADTSTDLGSDWDPDAQYNQAPPPLKDGWHFGKLRNVGRKDANGVLQAFEGPRSWGANVQTYYTIVEAEVTEPEEMGKRATMNVTTHPEKTQDGSPRGSSANMLYRAMTGEPLPGVSQGKHMVEVAKQLQAGPEVWFKTRLEGQEEYAKEYNAKKKAGTLTSADKKPRTYRGEKEFRTNGDGKHDVNGKYLTGVRLAPTESGLLGVDGAPAEVTIIARPVVVDVKGRDFVPPSGGGR